LYTFLISPTRASCTTHLILLDLITLIWWRVQVRNRYSSLVYRWATSWTIKGSSPDRGGNFSLYHRVKTGSGAHPASYLMGIMRQGHEADHSPPSSAEVKNAWSYNSTPPIRLHGVVLS
jgi:hypothetical protein